MIGYKKTSESKDEWLTPPEIIQALGEFDLDPCAPITRPWPTANTHYTIEDNGLLKPWFGRVWLNPPYSRGVMEKFLHLMALHAIGITLIPARTDINAFHELVFSHCDSILFIKGRLTFYHIDGRRANHNSGGPTALIAYGQQNSESLHESGIAGKHISVNSFPVIVAGYDRTWTLVLKLVMIKLNTAGLDRIYEEVERLAPEKVERNQHYKAKVRQTLQLHFKRIGKAKYAYEHH